MDSLSSRSRIDLAAAAHPDGRSAGVILAVGDVSAWRGNGRTLPGNTYLAFVEFHEVTRHLLDTMSPSLILSPLLSRRFDCVDLAQLLYNLGYKGRYRALDDRLPNPEIIDSEVRSLVPGLDFRVTRVRVDG